MRGWVALVTCGALLAGCKKAEAPPEPKSAPASADQPATPTAAPAPMPPGQAPGTAAPAPTLGQEKEEPKPEEKRKDALGKAPTTIAEAEKQLDQAVADLSQLTGGRSGGSARATPLAAGDARCADACKAMESLRRAAAAVCRLAGEENARCARAKGIVKDSEARVAACKCEPSKD